jgi:ABC-2 type transport system ATP-binding protein
MNSVVVEDLKKHYKQVKAVDGISFSVPQGEIFGMLGPNGAGKTTTVETIVGLTPRDTGVIQVMGYDPAKQPLAVKSRIGVQLQTASMFPRLTVKETVELYANFYPKALDEVEAIELVGLAEKTNTQTIKLSGGQLQRLSIALALVGNGDAIFLDEPTTGLDPQARRALWNVILKMKERGKTIFLTTHYMDEAEKLCDRVAVVDQGKIIAMDSPKGLIHQHFPEKAVEFKSLGLNFTVGLEKIPGAKRIQHEEDIVIIYTADVPGTISFLLQYFENAQSEMEDLIIRTATLEDVFLELTGRRLRE